MYLYGGMLLDFLVEVPKLHFSHAGFEIDHGKWSQMTVSQTLIWKLAAQDFLSKGFFAFWVKSLHFFGLLL